MTVQRHKVTLYGKADCCLCDEAMEVLHKVDLRMMSHKLYRLPAVFSTKNGNVVAFKVLFKQDGAY